jgi:hypothetical protein
VHNPDTEGADSPEAESTEAASNARKDAPF